MWFYLPVAIRLINGDDIHGVSGLHIVQINESTMDSFVLGVCHLKDPQKYRIIVNAHDPHNLDDPKWYPASVHENHEFALDLKRFTQNGFTFFPHDSVRDPRMSLLQLSFASDAFVKHNKHRYLPLTTSKTCAGSHVSVVSYPFNFTNSILFSSFHSTGTICAQLPNLLLSDVKYLENMAGGVVLKEGGVAGLVLGNLRKKNGDGDLVAIVPWSAVQQIKNLHDIPGDSHDIPGESHRNTPTVLPIVVNSHHGTTWGSCVVYNSNTLVTNTHVLEPYLNSSGEVTVFADRPINVKREDIRTPSPGLDLSFITIESSLVPVTKAQTCSIGEAVTTKGFGLFVDKSNPHPLISHGHINTVFPLPLNGSLINSLIVTSSSCWNGSSGGGLFNASNQLVGLICSNAQVTAQAVYDDPVKSSEKISKVVFVLPVEMIDYCYHDGELSSQVADVWTMGSFHTDVVVQESKL